MVPVLNNVQLVYPLTAVQLSFSCGKAWVVYDAKKAVCALTLGSRKPSFSELNRQEDMLVSSATSFRELPRPLTLKISSSSFEQKVYQALLGTCAGMTITYGTLAERIGHHRADRAVGSALAKNPIALLIPCHRVVPKSGGVGKYAYGTSLKSRLLLRETQTLSPLLF